MNKEGREYVFYKYSVLTFLMMVSAINFNMFISPGKIVAGGSNGIAVIINSLFGFDSSIIILVTSIIILLFGLIFKEYRIVLSALYASLIYPLFVKVIGTSFNSLYINSTNLLVIAVFSGVISGLISGVNCRLGISQGGVILIAQTIAKRIHGDVSKINAIINIIIVVSGGFVFGVNNIMYAIVFLLSSKVAMDRVILGISQRKLFQIVTYEEEKVKDYIYNGLQLTFTTFNAKGTTNEHNTHKRTVIMSSVTNRDYFKLKEGIKEIDPRAFVLVTDSYEVRGGK